MKYLSNHPSLWLADDAAASFDRWEATYGILELSDAGRTDAEQQELVRRWNVGGTYNRPPYLYLPAYPSPHQSGLAIDTPEHVRFSETCDAYGWRFNITSDPVHAIFELVRDTHNNETSNIGEDEDMAKLVLVEIPLDPNTGGQIGDGNPNTNQKHWFCVNPENHTFWHVVNNGQLNAYKALGIPSYANQGNDWMLEFKLLKRGESA